ncbi:MAG: serine hydrolase [Bacteroidia bacterium]|nr:MAG: serine hydrolase [Bacteroidia bacterium]
MALTRLALLVASVMMAPPQEHDVLLERAQQVAEYLEKAAELPESLFAQIVLDRVGIGQLRAVFQTLHQQLGRVTFMGEVERNGPYSGRFRFRCEKGFYTIVTLSVENRPPHKINGLFFGPPAPAAKSFDDLRAAFEQLPGTVSVLLRRLDPEPADLLALNSDEQLAIGSTFKLYVLGALLENGWPWEKVVRLKREWKSLPSGVLHKWPDQAPLTVHTLATQMISISDNTASDHLIHLIGRRAVEKALVQMGHSNPRMNMPFLTTREMFTLKSDVALLEEFIRLGVEERREFLQRQVAAREPNVYAVPSTPTAIDRVEWFASVRDLCAAMDYFRRTPHQEAREILAINPGVGTLNSAFTYVGYKGGSEAGVLNLTWLLRTREGAWYALSATWNNPEADVDQTKFVGYAQAVLDLLADQNTGAP